MERSCSYSWVVLIASFFTLFFGPSINYATGVFHVALLEQFHDDVTITAWVGSVFSSLFALTGPLASLLINVFDCRTCVVTAGILLLIGFSTCCLVTDIKLLFITYGVIAGVGTGLGQTGALVSLGYYFPKNNGLASGICVTGAGLGVFVHPVLVQYLFQTYGFHGAFLMAGAITFHICICGMLMRPSPFERKRQNNVLNDLSCLRKLRLSSCGDLSTFTDVVTNISFLFLALSFMCFSLALSTVYLYLPAFYLTKGATFQESSFAISASGIGSIISRLLTGFASSDDRIGGATMQASISGIIGIVTLFLPQFSGSSTLRIVYGFILGLYTGGVWVVANTLTLQIIGLKNYATGIGLMMFSCGTGYLCGPPLAGFIFSNSGSYYSVFFYCAVMFLATTVFGFMSALTKQKPPSVIVDDVTTTTTTLTKEKLIEKHVTEASEIEELIPAVANHTVTNDQIKTP